uniref:Uncharacterized protein n=1 Tax=Equus asinus asinus TaxID=83772 RepID=A0A8C4LKA8_EQUAS
MNGISVLIEEDQRAPSPLCEDAARRLHVGTRKQVLSGHRIYQQRDPGLPSLQNCEKQIFVVYKPSNLWCFCYSSPNRLREGRDWSEAVVTRIMTVVIPGVELIKETLTKLETGRPVGGALIPHHTSSITPNERERLASWTGSKTTLLLKEDFSLHLATAQPMRNTTAQPMRNAAAQPMRNATAQPMRNAAAQPMRNATVQPMRNAAAQPMRDATAQPMRNAAAWPMRNAAAQPMRNATAQPMRNAAAQPMRNATVQPMRNAAAQPMRDATAQPMRNAAAWPMRNATAQPMRNATAQPMRNAAAQPMRNTTAQPMRNAAAWPMRNATAQPMRSCPELLLCPNGVPFRTAPPYSHFPL